MAHGSRFSKFVGKSIEAKDLNFVELCARRYPGKQWAELDIKDQVGLIQYGLTPEHFMIDPHSTYVRYWDLVLACALLFTGVVTPYEVIFVGEVGWDDWLFIVNRIMDFIFLKDMVMQFFLQVEVNSFQGKSGTVLLKDPWKVRRRYLKSWFPIDIISMAPFDIFFLLYDKSDSLSGIKILRCMRLMRLIKLARILRTSRIILRWQNYFAISFSTQKLASFSFILMLSSHWMACLWGLVGITFGKEMCDADGKRIPQVEDIAVQDISWVTVLFTGGKASPDDPCNPWHVYIASLHWSVMTITSIGYGDIVPMRNAEYVTCILCMLVGGVLWAYIIGATCGLIANADPIEGSFETNTDLLNVMMREANVPTDQRQLFREYLREAKCYDEMSQFRQVAQTFSPLLRGQLLVHVSSAWVRKVHYLQKAPERCVMEMAQILEMRFFSRKEIIADLGDGLATIERGTLASAGQILMPGGVFQTDFIVHNARLRKHDHVVSLTYSLILLMPRDRFFEIIEDFPDFAKSVARAAMKMAMMRIVLMCADQENKSKRNSKSEGMWPSMVDVFESLEIAEGGASSGLEARLRGLTGELLEASSPCQKTDALGQSASSDKDGVEARLDTLEACLAASASAAQTQLAEVQRHLEELRSLRSDLKLRKVPGKEFQREESDIVCI